LPLPIFLRPEACWFHAVGPPHEGGCAHFCRPIQPILNPSAEILGSFIGNQEFFS
jgi:hypothetical protein